jgi:hypothetical protein
LEKEMMDDFLISPDDREETRSPSPDDGKFEYCGIRIHKPPMCFTCREHTACYKCKECGHTVICKMCLPEWSAKRRDKIIKKEVLGFLELCPICFKKFTVFVKNFDNTIGRKSKETCVLARV